MAFFSISAKKITFVVVYLMLIYTVCYGFSAGAQDSGSYTVVVPTIAQSRLEVNTTVVEAESDSGWFGALVGLIVGTIIAVVTFPIGGVVLGSAVATLSGTLPVAIAVSLPIAGAVVGYGLDYGVHALGFDMPWDDFVGSLQQFFGSVFDLFLFMVSFLTFGLVGDAFVGFPPEFFWIPYLMALPVWLYFLIIVAGFAVEAWKAVKIW